MTKKQFLSTALASLIAINTLVGCQYVSRNNKGENSNFAIEDVFDETINYGDYQITIADALGYKQGNEVLVLYPAGFTSMPNNPSKCFIVKKEVVTTYSAAKRVQEDGTVTYYAPFGGTLSGNKVVKSELVTLNSTEGLEVLNEYLQSKKLQKTM